MKKVVLCILLIGFCTVMQASLYQASMITLSGPTNDEIVSPYTANNASGNAVAVWVEGSVVMARYYNGSTWLPAETLSDGGEVALEVKCCLDDSNRAVAIWQNNTRAVRASTFNGQVWSAPEALSITGSICLGSTALACNNAGEAVAVWILTDGSGFRRVQSASYNGTSWTTPNATTFISAVNKEASYTALAMTDSNAVVAWTNNTDQVPQARISTNSGVTWQAEEAISDGVAADRVDAVAVDINTSGVASLVFHKLPIASPNEFVQASIFMNGQWSTPERISASFAALTELPSVSINDNNRAIAAWHNVTIPALRGAYFDGTQWLGPQTIDQAGSAPNVVLNNGNVAAGSWIGGVVRGSIGPIACATGAGFENGIWSSPQSLCGDEGETAQGPFVCNVLGGASEGYAVVLDMNESSQAVAAWVQEAVAGGAPYRLQSIFVFPGVTPQVNQELNRFPTQGDLFNSLQWTLPAKEPAQVVVQRNGEAIAFLPGSTSTYEDHNRSAAQQDEYSIAFIN